MMMMMIIAMNMIVDAFTWESVFLGKRLRLRQSAVWAETVASAWLAALSWPPKTKFSGNRDMAGMVKLGSAIEEKSISKMCSYCRRDSPQTHKSCHTISGEFGIYVTWDDLNL